VIPSTHEDVPDGAAPGRTGDAYAMAWSGGKDSTLALHRARRQGFRITHLFTLFDGATDRVPYHGVQRSLIEAQAGALGVELMTGTTGEDLHGDGPEGFEAVLLDVLDRLATEGIKGVVFGNIHLQDVRDWYEDRVRDRGLDHVEPLWGGEPLRLAREFVTLGYRGRVVSVHLENGDPAWLGTDLDVRFLERVGATRGVDAAGEQGEYHTFVWDGPLFHRAVPVRGEEVLEIRGHRILDLQLGDDERD
jgi:uncharacterized protein (TIGR00290 family)